jgi:hypothetical protein
VALIRSRRLHEEEVDLEVIAGPDEDPLPEKSIPERTD